MAYISESKRAYKGSFFGEARFSSDDHFFWRVFLKERKRLGFERLGFESKEKRCIRKVYIYNILLIFLGEK